VRHLARHSGSQRKKARHRPVIHEVPIGYHRRTCTGGTRASAHRMIDLFANIIRGHLRRWALPS